ncbi:copper amine oxidase [Cohnella faecalis]|uniref:Copper amine oxidase n=1 Tax=Cohnella faecalis TaxID=2315694 RepID=A0A398CSV4_9BACL|nr:copper amine oxidase [Cohnella faecalis]
MLATSVPLNAGWLAVPVAHAADAKAATVTYKLVKQSEAIVTSGVKQINYAWTPSVAAKTTEMLHVLQIDLTNKYVNLNAMAGKAGSVTTGQSVTAMAKETGAVAGVNGDVFNTATEGAPMGAQIESGKLVVSTSQLKGMYAFALTKDKKPVIDLFTFQGTVTAAGGATFALAGMNKSAYKTEPDKAYSHVDALYMYTSDWTASERPTASATKATEALVVNGVVTEVSASGTPIATPIPENGYILRGHGKAAAFITGSLKAGDKVTSTYTLKSQTTGESYKESDFQMMVGGHTILLDQGKAAAFSRDINGVSGSADRARTAVGYSKDGKTAYLVTVEENGGREGVTLKELQQMLLQLGVWKAVNLDGGGSTTMVSRPLGEYTASLTHPTSYGTTQRLVSNGIGVYTTAPKGTIKGITATSGATTLFIGQQTTFQVKAYDSYYNPVDKLGFEATWKISGGIGTFKDGVLTAAKAGKATVSVKAGTASSEVGVEVIGASQIERLTVDSGSVILRPGAVISVPVKARLKDGREISVPASSLQWEFKGFEAKASGGKLTVTSVEPGITAGYAIARYDGLGTAAILAPGSEKVLADFEDAATPVSFSALPAETTGTASIIGGVPGRETSNVLSLYYDFTYGKGSRFAYANLLGADGKGIAIDGNPSALTLDVLGDSSFNWIRGEFVDSKGKQVLVDIARTIDWSGWKSIKVDLTKASLTTPARLTKLYVVNLEQDQDERALQGELAFDNVAIQYPPAAYVPVKPTIVLGVGKKQATLNGKTIELTTAPFTVNGVNYLPLRFVADALGAQVFWDNAARRVTVLREDSIIELWVGNSEITANGVRKKVIAAPINKNGSVYVPVRVISEQLGQTVGWEPKTKTITIR